MKKILIALVLLGMVGAGVGLYLFNKPLESTESMKSHYSMAASDLLQAFENNEDEANSKYLDKVIEVNGNVAKMDNKEGTITIYLDADNPLSSVIFQLEHSETNIKQGDDITLKGICTGYLMDVVMVRAVKV